MRKYLLLIIYTENKPSTNYTTKTKKKCNGILSKFTYPSHRNEMCLCKTKVPENRLGKSHFT